MNHSKLKWPENMPKIMYSCSICNSVIDGEENWDLYDDGRPYLRCYTPASRYWNIEHSQVYCNGYHSLEAHLKGYKL